MLIEPNWCPAARLYADLAKSATMSAGIARYFGWWPAAHLNESLAHDDLQRAWREQNAARLAGQRRIGRA